MGDLFLINAHGVLRRMGAVTEIPGNVINKLALIVIFDIYVLNGILR